MQCELTGAVNQIKEKRYIKNLESYSGNLLLVGINYNIKTKRHECVIESVEKTDDHSDFFCKTGVPVWCSRFAD